MTSRSRVSINGARGLFKVVCAALLLVPGSALAASFAGLGTLNVGDSASYANAVSSDGLVVVGSSVLAPSGSCAPPTDCTEGWKWTAASGLVGIGFPPLFSGGPPVGTTSTAVDVSADGTTIAGHGLVSGLPKLFRWHAFYGFEVMNPPPPLYTDLGSGVQAISGDGDVVLGYTRSEPPSPLPPMVFTRTEVWTFTFCDRSSTVVDCGGGFSTELDTTFPLDVGRMKDLSFDGRVAPVTTGYFDEPQAQRWYDGKFEGLLTLNWALPPFDTLCTGFFPCTAEANAVSSGGQILVGQSYDQASLWSTARGGMSFWPDYSGVVGLGFLPGAVYSTAVDVSANGERVVGQSPGEPALSPSGFLNLFLWSPETGMLELGDVLTQAGVDLTGWTFSSQEVAISDDGSTVVGTGINPSGNYEAWRAVLPDLGTLTLPAQPPMVVQPNLVSSVDGDAASFALMASDPNGDPLSFVASGLPPGLSIDGSTGVISGTHPPGSDASSPYTVSVQVSDGSQTVSIVFSWTVLTVSGVPGLGPAALMGLAAMLVAAGSRRLRAV